MSSFLYCVVIISWLAPTFASDAVVIVGSQLKTSVQTTVHEINDPNIVDVTCLPQQMCISMSLEWLEKTWRVALPSQLGLGAPCLAPLFSNSTHVTLCTEDGFLLSCGTSYKVNDSHVIYSSNVTVQTNRTGAGQSDSMVAYSRWFPWSCIFPVRLLVGVRILPQISPITQFLGRQTGLGEFQAVMMLFKDPVYQIAYDVPPRLTSKDKIRVQVKLMEGPLLAKLQVVHCWGTPEQQALNDKYQYPLIENYCPKQSSADVTVQNNGFRSFVRWESKVFQFINFTEVYLHCNVRVCFDGTMCEKTCDSTVTSSKRKRRSAYVEDAIVSVGPISPASNVIVVQGLQVEMDDVIEGFKNDFREENDFPQYTETILGMPREVLHAFVILLSALFLIFLVATLICVWRKKRISKQSEILKHLALPPQPEDDITFSMALTSSRGIPLP